jgi:voltage-gated potassium channel
VRPPLISLQRDPAAMTGLLFQLWRLLRALVRVVRDPEGRALAVLVLVQLLSGTIFYRLAEGWRWLDSLYFSVTTLATVGLGDLTPATDAGKVFTMHFILTGVGTLAAFVTLLAGEMRPPREDTT